MDNLRLTCEIRAQRGKGAARKLRAAGKLPAILYGAGMEPVMLTVDYLELKKALKGRSAENVIFDLRIDSGRRGQSRKVMIKEIQRDPVKREYLHADFYEISMKQMLEVDVPVNLVNTPIGVTLGGILQHVRREVRVSCMPDDLVDKIDVDVAGLEIGQSLHVEDISFPPGLEPLEDGDLTIVTVGAPTVTAEAEELEEAEEEEVEETEGEEIEGEERS